MQNDLNSFIERCQRLTMGLWTNFGRLYGTGSGGFGPFEYIAVGYEYRAPRALRPAFVKRPLNGLTRPKT
jgi:hypothetical protein